MGLLLTLLSPVSPHTRALVPQALAFAASLGPLGGVSSVAWVMVIINIIAV